MNIWCAFMMLICMQLINYRTEYNLSWSYIPMHVLKISTEVYNKFNTCTCFWKLNVFKSIATLNLIQYSKSNSWLYIFNSFLMNLYKRESCLCQGFRWPIYMYHCKVFSRVILSYLLKSFYMFWAVKKKVNSICWETYLGIVSGSWLLNVSSK